MHGTFLRSSKYRKRDGNGEWIIWETALPSRLAAKLAADFPQQLETARTTYHRFGQYSRALDQIRSCLEHKAIERTELEAALADDFRTFLLAEKQESHLWTT